MPTNNNFLSGAYGGIQPQSTVGSGDFLGLPNTDYLSSFQQNMTDTNSFVDSNLGIDPMSGINNNLATQEQGGFFINEQGGAGWGTHAIGAGAGLAQTFLGFSQLSEGKKQNKIAQQQWQSQFDIQKEEYDRRVSERQARIANANAAKANAKGG